jgi:hypothetical protein
MKWNLGDKITSITIEEHGAVGTIVDVDFDRVRVDWATGGQSYENNEDLILIRRFDDTTDYLRIREPPIIHQEDIHPAYEPHLDFYAEGNIPFATRNGPDIAGLIDDRPQRQISNPVILNAYYKAREERQARDINLALLKDAVTPHNKYTIPMEEWNIAKQFVHKKIGQYDQLSRDWEPGDLVAVSRPGKNAGHLSTAHVYRVRPTTADVVWIEPVSGKEIHTTEELNELIFINHDYAWRKEREDRGERLEAEEFNAGWTSLNHKDMGYDTMDYGYPTRLIPNELDYEMFFTQNIMRDYLGNQVKKHPVGDNQLEEYKLMELQYGGVTKGFQPFRGFERFADYLWR